MTVGRVSGRVSHFESLDSRFIGRKRELSTLEDALQRARAGLGGIFLVSGEAGTGKSFLVSEFSAFARTAGAKVLEGCASVQFRDVPFGIWRQILAGQGSQSDAIAPDSRPHLDAPSAMFSASSNQLADQHRTDPALFETTARALVEQARDQPLVLVLDDLHAADPLSLEAFRILGRKLSPVGVLVIGVYRDSQIRRFREFRELLLDPLIRNSKRILLGAFDDEETREFALRRSARPLEESRLTSLGALSGGNPRLLEIAIQLHRLDEPSLGSRESLGGALRSEIEAHLEHLPFRTREILSIASLEGVEFRLSLLVHVLECEPEELLDALDEAEQSGLLKHPEIPGIYRFRQGILHEILSAELGGARSARIHRRLGEILETLHPDDDAFVESIARHFYEAAPLGCADKAADYCCRAAVHAHRESRLDDGLRFYHMAMVALELKGSTSDAIRNLKVKLDDLTAIRDERSLREQPSSSYLGDIGKVVASVPNGTVNGEWEVATDGLGGGPAEFGPRPASFSLATVPTLSDRHPTDDAEKNAGDIWKSASVDAIAQPPSPMRANTFLREGDFWTLIFEEKLLHLKHSNGLLFLAHLFRHPNRDLHVTQLMALLPSAAANHKHAYLSHSDKERLGMHTITEIASDPLLDRTAKAEYRHKIEELREGLEQARAFNDAEKVAELESELEFVAKELSQAVGVGGRDRKHRAEDQRARVNVTNAIRMVIAKISREHSSLARYLRLTIRTGHFCSYNPDPRATPSWRC